MSRKARFLSATLAAVAVIATVAVARTIQTYTVSADRPPAASPARATTGSGTVRSAVRYTTPAPLHGMVGCGGSLGLGCDEVEQLLPQ